MNNRQKLVQERYLKNEKKVIDLLDDTYGKALADVNAKIKNLDFKIGELTEQYDWMDTDDPEREKVKSMIQSKIYQKNYQQQLKSQLDGIVDQITKKQFTTVSDYLDTCYEDGFVGAIFDQFGQGIPLVTPINQESVVKAVQLDSKIKKGLYTRLGEDIGELKTRISSTVSRAIATGMTYSQAAKQIEGQSKIGFNRAVRIARTEGHRIQNSACMDAMHGAKDRGADIVKQWDATLDFKTRDSHVAVDGQIRELDEEFSNNLMYPGDPSGGAAEVVNCRCTMLQMPRWALQDGFTKMNNITGELEEFESPEDYDEFKKAFFSNENKAYMKQVDDMIEKYHTKNMEKLLEKMDEQEYEKYSRLLKSNPLFNK